MIIDFIKEIIILSITAFFIMYVAENLKNISRYIYDNKVQAIKKEEQDELKQALLSYGKEEGGQKIYRFSDDTAPIVAGYLFDNPCDIVIKKVAIDEDGNNLKIIGEDIEARGQELVINPNNIFAGHIDFIADSIL